MGVPVSWQIGLVMVREISTFWIIVSSAPCAAEPAYLFLPGLVERAFHVGGEFGGRAPDEFNKSISQVLHEFKLFLSLNYRLIFTHNARL